MKKYRCLVLSALMVASVANASAADAPKQATNGPTIDLACGKDRTATNSVDNLMYFVPLISPEPVQRVDGPGGAQSVRMLSVKRHISSHWGVVNCDMEVQGDGSLRNVFNLAPAIRRNKSRLEKGEPLKHRLKAINILGPGFISVEAQGFVNDNIVTPVEVRLHFNAHGHTSPVWIDLCDVCSVDGNICRTNEIMARVNTLTFRRQTNSEPPKMEVSISSIKPKGASNGFFQDLAGGIKGMAANMFIPPLRIEMAGDKAMLDFGQALISGAPTFTFPVARNMSVFPLDDGLNRPVPAPGPKP